MMVYNYIQCSLRQHMQVNYQFASGNPNAVRYSDVELFVYVEDEQIDVTLALPNMVMVARPSYYSWRRSCVFRRKGSETLQLVQDKECMKHWTWEE